MADAVTAPRKTGPHLSCRVATARGFSTSARMVRPCACGSGSDPSGPSLWGWFRRWPDTGRERGRSGTCCGAAAARSRSPGAATKRPTAGTEGASVARPPAFDEEVYRERNVVERCFVRPKQLRAIATRFDKLADRYRAGVVPASLILWLRETSS